MNDLARLKLELKRGIQGIVIGASVGAIAASVALSKGYGLAELIEAGGGVLANVMGRSSPTQIATVQLYGAFMTAGAAVGLVIDKIVTVYFIRGKRRR